MEVTIDTTITFEHLLECKGRVSQQIGGSRSGKTYAILQYLIVKALEGRETITIVRKTIPSLKRTVMKDFKDIMIALGLWKDDRFNISDRIYQFDSGSVIQFISTDDAEKLRGVKSDYLFIEEASEVDEESAFQLGLRTTKRIIYAFNPTVSPYHWLRTMEDCERYVTTYKDNPYLEKEVVRAIEDLKTKNEKYWKIYGLGEYAPNERAIFQFETIEFPPEDAEFIAYGMDFGFANDPTTLIGVFRNGEGIYLVELLYEKGMITSEIIDALKSRVNPRDEIWCDSSDPRLIEEIYRAGFNAKPVKKGPDSIRFGISVMQNYKIHVTKKSQNLINEMYSYQWAVDKHQHTTDVPEGGLDHCIDAARYVAMMKLSYKASNQGKYVIRIK